MMAGVPRHRHEQQRLRRRRAWRSGHWAEAVAAMLLRLKGYRILARRFRAPVGEIDIVARRGEVLAMVEVKSRATLEEALLALPPRQRRRIERAAQAFLARDARLAGLTVRFDVMLIVPWRRPKHIMHAWHG